MSDPKEKIQSLVEEKGSQSAVAELLGVSNAYISDILKGKRDVSENMARRLGYKRIVCFEQLPGPEDADRPILVIVEKKGKHQ